MRSRGPESFWGQMMPHSSATKQLRRRRDELEQWLARGVSEAPAKRSVQGCSCPSQRPPRSGLVVPAGPLWCRVGGRGAACWWAAWWAAPAHMKAKMYISSCPIWFEPPIFALPCRCAPADRVVQRVVQRVQVARIAPDLRLVAAHVVPARHDESPTVSQRRFPTVVQPWIQSEMD